MWSCNISNHDFDLDDTPSEKASLVRHNTSFATNHHLNAVACIFNSTIRNFKSWVNTHIIIEIPCSKMELSSKPLEAVDLSERNTSKYCKSVINRTVSSLKLIGSGALWKYI